MGMIIERNCDGVVKAGNTTCEIPQDMSMLAVLGNNPMIHSAKYKEDGWIYVDDKRVQKWFRRWDRINVWPPVLEDVAALEDRRWKVLQKTNEFYAKTWKPVFDEMIQAGKAHAKPTHNYVGDRQWWLYRVSDFDERYLTRFISFDWVDEPEEKLNQELGQKYYEIDRQLERYYKYSGLFRTILGVAIDHHLRDNYPPERDGITLKFVINGRVYWYNSVMGHCRAEWRKASWPETEMIELNL